MSVFISWSGSRSKQVAQSLRGWLPNVLQAAEVWMSDVDIEAGMRGINEIFSSLEKARVGIICVTPENTTAPWLLFEAGAISKQMADKTRVCPYLLDLPPADVPKPIAEFQSVACTQEGTKRLLKSVNSSLESGRLMDDKLDMAFGVWWSRLECELNSIKDGSTALQTVDKQEDKLTEILGSVREILRRFDLDREFYTSPQAVLKSLASRQEVREELVKDAREGMKELFGNPGFTAEVFKNVMSNSGVRETMRQEADESLNKFSRALRDLPQLLGRSGTTERAILDTLLRVTPELQAELSRVNDSPEPQKDNQASGASA